MKNIIKYLFLLLKSIMYPVIFFISEILIISILKFFGDANSNLFLIINSIICLILWLFIFKLVRKKYNIKLNIFSSFKNTCFMAIFLAIGMNMIIVIINSIFSIENNLNDNILVMTLLSGIIGPILEEIVFRGFVFEELKKFNSINKSIILCSIIFAVFHDSFTQMIYAFIIGYVILKLYVKNNNFLTCIVFHVCANTVISLLFNGFVLIPIYLLILLSVFFLLSFYYLYRYKN